jgi:hypothetical protein
MSAGRSLSLHRVSLIALVLLALPLVSRDALTQALRSAAVHLASESQASATRSQSDSGGQTASPNPNSGSEQEEKVRRLLAEQYEQRLGASDEAIRSALGLRGKVADFVGYNARQNRWLIAESKGGNIGDAFDQLANTTKGLLDKYPGAQVKLRIYVNVEKYSILERGGDLGGYVMNAQRQLGWVNELKQWVDAEIAGVKILALQAP